MAEKKIIIEEYKDIVELDDMDFLLVASQVYQAGIEKSICIMSDAHIMVKKLKMIQEDIDALLEKYDFDECSICEDENSREVPLVFDETSD